MRFLFFIPLLLILIPAAVFPNERLTLSLNEAIFLAVRSNPNVQSSQLNYLAQKFNTHVQEWEFTPHYSVQAQAIFGRASASVNTVTGSSSFNVAPTVSLQTPIGTQMNLVANNPDSRHFNPGLSLQIMQPLMRGFGMPIVEAALCNAKDSEVVSRLLIEATLRTTVTMVIMAYIDVVAAERNIMIDKDALKRAEKAVEQTKMYIKGGHKAGNELVTVKANVASAKSQLENDKNNLIAARYALLSAIGLDPNTDVQFTSLDVEALLQRYHSPTLEQAKCLILANDIQYQVDQITLHGPTSRNLLVAEDNTRWQLNFTANGAAGSGVGGNVGLTLNVPIDDQHAKQAVVNARIAIQQAELALMQEKWAKQTSAINGWNTVRSAERSLHFAKDAENWQEKTYHVNYQKYLHGLIDSLELQSAQLQLIQAQQTLLLVQMTYLKALVNLDYLVGHTLRTWDVRTR